MPSLYEITVPIFTRGLRNLDHLLAKASASGVSETELLGARLAPDMHPLTNQVQMICDTAKLAVTRVAKTEPLPMVDDEKSIAELRARIARTIAYVEKAEPAAFEGRENAELDFKPTAQLTFTGQSLITDFSLPNFFFHLTTAYGLLRMKGVEIGKMDFLLGDQAAS